MLFPHISDAVRIQRLEAPTGKVRMVLDTDTYNEIDDQFAVAYSLLSPEKLDVEAIYAAPFDNNKSGNDPAIGMEKSHEEILRLLKKLGRSPEGFVFKGATQFLRDGDTPCHSDAVADLIQRAMATDESPLYVVAIGAITNIASAILAEPDIINRIVVVWLGGHSFHWPHTKEFNLRQDVAAARVVFDCGVPVVQIPCSGVTTHLRTTVPELAAHIQGRSAIGDYLYNIFYEHKSDHFAWSKEIWDIAAVAWLVNPAWVPSNLVPSPIITDQITWAAAATRHTIRSAYYVNRDPIFRDLFEKISRG